jgi:hypothetical protein
MSAQPRIVDQHRLKFNDERLITGCQCGFVADHDDDGYGDSVVEHLVELGLQANLANLELDEIRGRVERVMDVLLVAINRAGPDAMVKAAPIALKLRNAIASCRSTS